MIKGAIFDLDGTLLDSMWIWDTIGEDYLRSLGYEPKEDINALFKTFSLRQAAEHYKTRYEMPMSVEELMDGVNKTVENYYFHTVTLKEGVKELLERLYENGVSMCIATATDKYQVEAAITRLGIKYCFSDILTCTEVGHGKDEPIIYQKALEALRTDRSNTLVVEDSLYALRTAKNDGFITVGIYDGHNSEQTEIKSYSDLYLYDFKNITKFIGFAEQL